MGRLQRREERGMIRPLYLLASLAAATSLSACGTGGEKLDQTGKNPKLPKIDETLVPPMNIAKPPGWNGETPTVPAGYKITAVETDLQIPPQLHALQTVDIPVPTVPRRHAPNPRPQARHKS